MPKSASKKNRTSRKNKLRGAGFMDMFSSNPNPNQQQKSSMFGNLFGSNPPMQGQMPMQNCTYYGGQSYTDKMRQSFLNSQNPYASQAQGLMNKYGPQVQGLANQAQGLVGNYGAQAQGLMNQGLNGAQGLMNKYGPQTPMMPMPQQGQSPMPMQGQPPMPMQTPMMPMPQQGQPQKSTGWFGFGGKKSVLKGGRRKAKRTRKINKKR